ncbi:MAG: alpha/beta fold hydrolase [Moraxellaceae bacterium]|nr:alpha/beta fold hydrolase [Moraxellaceae bacterium]
MKPLFKRGLDAAQFVRDRGFAIADNAFDWLFLRETLVKSGLTYYETIFESDPMSLRYYPPPEESYIELAGHERVYVEHNRLPVPLVLVPPLGVTTESFDLMPQRSLARYMAARGFHVYLIDWGKPEKRHANLGLQDYAQHMFGDALREVRQHSGSQDVSLMGWCMGGLLSLLYSGFTHDPHVRNMVTIASPIDMRGGGMVAQASTIFSVPAKVVRKLSSFRLHNISPKFLHSPGWMTTLSFKLTDPIGSITTYWDLVTKLWDREFVTGHSTTSDYLNNMLDYPGGVIQDMMVKMAVDNQMAKGRVEVRGAVADLSQITANMLVFAGKTDVLVSPGIARGIINIVASKDKQFHIAPGGHMGVILGSSAVKSVWEPVVNWLNPRSQNDAAKEDDLSSAEALNRQARHRRIAEDPTL